MLFRPSDVCSSDGCGLLYQVLLLHKPRKKDSWQLPQGGVEEGETTQEAALRELKEEAGIEARVLGKSSQVYQYDFPPSYRRFRPDNVCGQRIEFIFATVQDGQRVVVDQHEIDQHTWVLKEELATYVQRKEYLQLAEALFEEGKQLLS